MICPNCRIENAAEGRYCRNCATPLRPLPAESPLEAETLDFAAQSLRPGITAAGRFQVIEELGKNALGTAYKVYDVTANETISLKIIHPDLAADPASMGRLRACIRRALKISHKNVCRVYHLGEDNGTRYITMEYIPGESLKSVMRMTKQLSVRTAVGVAGQICEGLSEAHRQGVVHGDLRPESIMIGRDGEARIMDLGFACLSAAAGQAGPAVTADAEGGASAGDRAPKDWATRPDIHALGAILYEMVTGEPPFPPASRSLPPGKKNDLVPRDPREINGQVSKDLSRLILRCLDGGDKQFETAEEVRSELARVAKDLPTTEHAVSSVKPALTAAASSFGRKGWLLASALLILAIVGSLSLAYFKSDKPQAGAQKKMIVVLPFENLSHPEDEYVTDGFTDEITNRLSALQGLGTISRTSAMRYKKTGKTLRQIGNELGVDYVLEGSVRWNRIAGDPSGPEGGRMRVTAQLIRVADDIHIWAETYEQDIENVFAVQTWIAEQVAQKLDLTLLAPEREALEDRPTANLRAYDYYLRGRKLEYRGWIEWKREDFLSAAEMFQKAVDLDPKFAVAYSQLSIINSRCFFFGIDRTEQRLAQAGAAAQKALELNPKLPDGKMALAIYYYWGF
ncbi:MAG: protein kinase, partial [Acidobacteriota bacterium]|nr:protein kinase [Acidobacteriota bacterium]